MVVAERHVNVAVLAAHFHVPVFVAHDCLDALIVSAQISRGRLQHTVRVLGRRVNQSQGPRLELLNCTHELQHAEAAFRGYISLQ